MNPLVFLLVSHLSRLAVLPAHGHAGHLHAMGAPEILHGSHLSKASFFLPSLMASCMVILQITLARGIVYSNLTTLHQS